ncbi:MAG: heme A synthase [Rickettsiales bacterium]|nr:heme A synthase [Rickettsiales bacterium]
MTTKKSNSFIDTVPTSRRRAVLSWLITSAFFVFCMAVIGAVTRLTESGLSMVEWRPLIGALPPMNEVEWNRVFSLYQQSPEYLYKNAGMSLPEFKEIFFWEWFHRLWGRLIGIVYAVPFFFFLARKYFNKAWVINFSCLLILGGLQGLMGWYMVKSGLINEPAVSHYRLAAHLSLAFIVFTILLYFAFDWMRLKTSIIRNFTPNRAGMAIIGLIMLALTIIWGAFVAGKDAGLIYNTFPKMGTSWLPSELLFLEPAWLNIFENHATIQFTHRILAILTVVYLCYWSFKNWHESRLFKFILFMALIQMSLGIATLLSHVWIPLAALHQAGALILIGLVVASLHQIQQNRLREYNA